MTDADILFHSATELAELVRSGEVTARELAEISLSRIEGLDGELGAFTTVVEDSAMAAADAIEAGDQRPFAGVPIAIKDLNTPVEGVRMAQGSDLVGDYVADHDCNVAARIRNAGFVIVGVTKSPEFGLTPVTEPRRFGPARNPWNRDRTPGGSSGGSAAAVAAGIVPIAHASDGGGSIRIPAAMCGLVGLKPSRGRISMAPDFGIDVAGLVTDGCVSHTVADTAAMLDLLSGYEWGDPVTAPPPAEPFAAAAAREPGKLRVGVTTLAPNGIEVDPSCVAAVMETADLLAELGHEVDEDAPEWADDSLVPLFTTLWATSAAQSIFIAAMLAGGKQAREADVEPLSWTLGQMAQEVSALDLANSIFALQTYTRRVVSWWTRHDVLLSPVSTAAPLRIGEIDTCSGDGLESFAKAAEFVPFTPPINVTGQPAISLPLTHGEDGLPRGVQLVGPAYGEALLLSLSAQLEGARPWAERRPELSTA